MTTTEAPARTYSFFPYTIPAIPTIPAVITPTEADDLRHAISTADSVTYAALAWERRQPSSDAEAVERLLDHLSLLDDARWALEGAALVI